MLLAFVPIFLFLTALAASATDAWAHLMGPLLRRLRGRCVTSPFVTAQPNSWCTPGTFGMREADVRVWTPPAPHRLDDLEAFRSAVVQHAFCVHVRRYKNQNGPMSQSQLAHLDGGRIGGPGVWNRRLRGLQALTLRDFGFLYSAIPPDYLPTPRFIHDLLLVAEHKQPPTDPAWSEVDS